MGIIQIAIATTQKEGIPVFHKTFNGNIHDSRTLFDIAGNFSKHGLKKGFIVYDRGIISVKNLNLLGKMGWDTLCGLPIREKEKAIIKKFLKNNSINNIANMVLVGRSTFYVNGMPHSFGTVHGKLVICYNESKKLEITESRRRKILEAKKLLGDGKEVNESVKKYLTPTGRVRTSILEEEEVLDGFSCIFCTKNLPNEEMVKLYFDKDVVEKSFRTLKGVSNLRPVRFWLSKRVKAHVFICYLSYLLLSALKLHLKSKGIELSPESAIEELETMYNVYLCDKNKGYSLVRTVALSKIQEKILKSVDSKILKDHVVKY